uniref:Unkown protein n=1 Tax=Riptortus pedestris TaxID=329032 RepID=R4WHU3_RIPPE|nr:unkown protein [Riptortus pedestris]
MKAPVALLLLSFVAVKATIIDESYLALLRNSSWAREVPYKSQLAAQDTNDDTCTAFYSCRDCKTAQICKPSGQNGIMELITTITCPQERPYCDQKSGTCVAEASGSCGEKDDTFICMGDGKFPDRDCTKFHVCVNLIPTLFTCAIPGQRFNPKTQTCEHTDTCGTFNCDPSNTGTKAAHSVDERYYAYCNAAQNGLLVVDGCPPMFRLDHETQTCVPDCKTDGIIPDPTDCHFYYKCSKVTVSRGIQYMSNTRLQCPDKMAYSQTDFICMPETEVESCKKKV